MRLLLAALLFALACFAPATPSVASTALAAIDLSSPQATYRSFMAEMRRIEELYLAYRADQTFAREADLLRVLYRAGFRIFDLRNVPATNRNEAASAAVGYLADILNRLPEPAFAAEPAPGTPPLASWTLPGTDLNIVRLGDGPRAGDYVVSADTVAMLPDVHALIIGEPPLRATSIPNWLQVQQRFTGPLLASLSLADLPEPLQVTLLGSPVWKLLLVLMLSIAVASATLAWSRLVRRWTARADALKRYLAWLTVPVLLAALTHPGSAFVSTQVNLAGASANGADIAAALMLYGAAAWAGWLAWWVVAEWIITSPRFSDTRFDPNLMRMIARVGSLLTAGVLIVLGFNVVGVPTLGLFAGVSLGGLAIALAAQSTLENLFGGVSIFADRPFRVGDTIRYGGTIGTAERIGPRSCRIRGPDGALTSVPNADLAKMQITNLTARNSCLFQHRFGVRYETSPAQLEWLLADLFGRVARYPLVETTLGFPRVRLVGLGDSSIDIEIFARVRTSDFNEFLAVQQALLLEILRSVEESGSCLAFPSRTTYLARDGGLDAETALRVEQEMARRTAEAGEPRPVP